MKPTDPLTETPPPYPDYMFPLALGLLASVLVVFHVLFGTYYLSAHLARPIPYWARFGAGFGLIVLSLGKKAPSSGFDLRFLPFLAISIALIPAPFWIPPYGIVCVIGAASFAILLTIARRNFLRAKAPPVSPEL